MSATSGGQASVRPDTNEKTPTVMQKQNSSKKTDKNTRGCSTRSCSFRLPKRRQLTPWRYLKHLGCKMVSGLQFVSLRCSPKVNSSERAKPFVAPVDSHRAEAIDDCIEFINSSSSFPRSNSVSR